MYLEEIAKEIAAQIDSELLPSERDRDRLLRLYAVLARAKGTTVTAEDVHDAWAVWMVEIDPDHSALRPYAELDNETRCEDAPFLEAIRAVAAEHQSDT